MELVSEANTSKKYISLKYFSETRQEIDNFFDTAKTIYKNDQMVEPGQTAMEMIIGGSKSLSDIEEKQSKFYYLLSKNHITEEKKADFYAPKYKTANFESFAYTDKELKDVRLISHINKLRNNQVFEDYAFAECILLSETGAVLEFSKKFISEKESELRSTSGKSDICLVPDFITQKNKSEKSKHTRKKVAFSIYVGYYFLIICLIVYLTWDVMEPVTYILGIPPAIYLLVSKLYETKWSLPYWINSYERRDEYQKAKEKVETYEKKEVEQQAIVKKKQEQLNSADLGKLN